MWLFHASTPPQYLGAASHSLVLVKYMLRTQFGGWFCLPNLFAVRTIMHESIVFFMYSLSFDCNGLYVDSKIKKCNLFFAFCNQSANLLNTGHASKSINVTWLDGRESPWHFKLRGLILSLMLWEERFNIDKINSSVCHFIRQAAGHK